LALHKIQPALLIRFVFQSFTDGSQRRNLQMIEHFAEPVSRARREGHVHAVVGSAQASHVVGEFQALPRSGWMAVTKP
jgi:hypothetical protein